jgi:hypothetical protein
MILAYIVWEDASELDASPWAEHDDKFLYKPVICHQVGFILYDGPEGIVITDGFLQDGTVSRRNQIPRGMIQKIIELKYPKTNENIRKLRKNDAHVRRS